MNDPREGLPPCVSAIVFDGRRAFMRDVRECQHGMDRPEQILVTTDHLMSWGMDAPYHPSHIVPIGYRSNEDIVIWTDDPAEAEAAWERAESWVRTGVLP